MSRRPGNQAAGTCTRFPDPPGGSYVPFKINSIENDSPAWRRTWGLFMYRQDEFLAHYHKRSNVESTFSAIKRKFGGAVRAKRFTAQVNEILARCSVTTCGPWFTRCSSLGSKRRSRRRRFDAQTATASDRAGAIARPGRAVLSARAHRIVGGRREAPSNQAREPPAHSRGTSDQRDAKAGAAPVGRRRGGGRGRVDGPLPAGRDVSALLSDAEMEGGRRGHWHSQRESAHGRQGRPRKHAGNHQKEIALPVVSCTYCNVAHSINRCDHW